MWGLCDRVFPGYRAKLRMQRELTGEKNERQELYMNQCIKSDVQCVDDRHTYVYFGISQEPISSLFRQHARNNLSNAEKNGYEPSTIQSLRSLTVTSPNCVCIRACAEDHCKRQKVTISSQFENCGEPISSHSVQHSRDKKKKLMCTSCAHVPILLGFGNLRKA